MKRIKPYKKILLPVFLFTWLCSPCPAEVELSPISISSYWDLGHVMNGTLDAPDDLEHSILNRLGAGITQKITYNQVFDVNIGVGGIFWTPFPMQAGAPWTFNTYFGPGLSQANGLYKWGDLEEPSAEFQVGLFNYKYNPEARNLGEYLFRSNAYPNILISGGWSYMNSAAYPVIGYRLGLSHFGGFFNHDFIVAVEMQNYPPQSISPAWVGTLNSGGIFEFGLGISFQHLLALSRDLITTKSLADPQTPFNRIVEFGDFPAIKPQTTYIEKKDYTVVRRGYPRGRIQLPETEFLGYEDAVVPYNAKYFDDKTTPNVIEKLIYIDPDRSTASSDSLAFKTVAGATDASFINTLDDSKHVETSQYVIPRSESYTTFRSIKAMARFSFDLGLLFGMEEQSFKFFGELGVLGILNQDYYYEKITDRIPLMLGVDIPTWGIFDIFSFQLEYFKSPHNNSMAIYRYGLSKNPVKDGSAIANAPVPGRPSFGSVISGYDDAGVTEIFYDNPSTDDDIKWTVFIKKTLTPGISLYCQAASDHMRTFSFEWAESYSPIYKSPGDWYFLFRLEYGI